MLLILLLLLHHIVYVGKLHILCCIFGQTRHSRRSIRLHWDARIVEKVYTPVLAPCRATTLNPLFLLLLGVLVSIALFLSLYGAAVDEL